jgi:serine/threonine protein kinase
LEWNSQVGAGLDYLHADLGESPPVLHRDVKPSNIIVTPADAAVLIDPGLARLVDAHVTGTPYGSPGFIPPECDRDPGTASPASDRWQLGATLVAALLGEPPARPLDRVDLRRRLVGRLRKNLASPGPIADEILRMTDPEPGARPSSAAAWAGRLLALEEAGSRPRRRTTMALMGATAVISAALGASVAVAMDGAMTHARPALASNASAFSKTAVVDNKVTSGLEMREDKPAYLSTRPANFCKRDGCALPNTDMSTGAKVTLVCQTIGPRDTNGDDSSPGDDKNLELFESRLWYGVRWPDGRFGFLSDVWLAPDFRGGLGLPLC